MSLALTMMTLLFKNQSTEATAADTEDAASTHISSEMCLDSELQAY